MSLTYSIREGLAGFRRAKFAFIASVSATTVALILIGTFALLTFKAQQVTSWMKQRVGELEVFLDEEVDEPTARAISARADLVVGVDEVEYVSREEAREVFRREFGEGSEIFLDEPFLPASVKVRVDSDYANPDSLQSLVGEFSSWARVDEVVFNQPLLVKVQQNLRLFTLTGLSLGALVVLAALFLVGNTIRLTIYARRLLIRTMKLVGATDAFIQRPFIVEGIMQGVIAGGIASLLLWGIYGMLAGYLPQFAGSDTVLLVLLTVGLVLLGALLGWLGSYFAVRRFIKNVALH
ncbi:MAG: ABC transporter permease [Bacteroidetes bacterium]|jgi:cell division transport system permease protein|nr:ABC transporter permease [Bacteroidota bacterium]